MSLSVIVTCLNDWAECTETIRSILATTDRKPEIVVVDDCSATPGHAMLPQDILKEVKLLQNVRRCGVGPSRHIGALFASGSHLLITDAHMRFTPGWMENALRRLEGRPRTVHCGTCLGLDSNNMDPAKVTAVYSGATLNVCGPDRHGKGGFQVMEACWAPAKPDDSEIPCVMGASYFIERDWFLKLAPLHHLRDWGQDEVQLSLKSWLAGGDVRIMGNVKIGHKFLLPGQKQPWLTEKHNQIYNKLFSIHTLCQPPTSQKLIQKLRECTEARIFAMADELISKNWGIIAAEQAHNRVHFRHNFEWFCQRFSIALP